MPIIKIKRNEAGNCITFEGSSNPVYWNSCLSGELDSSDNTLINVVNDIITAQSGSTEYEFFRIPYTDFIDADGNAFATPQDCADYITQEANVLGSIGEQIATPSDTFNFYLDAKDNTVIISTGDYFPVNTIQATLHTDNTLRIVSIVGVKTYYSNINLANVSIDNTLLTGTEAQKVNELNALFQNSGSTMGQLPTITSSLAVSLTTGDTLNYELTADYGVGYEWDLSNVSGIVNVEGNLRKIIGGSNLSAGTYNIPVKAINYNGEDSQTIVLTVSNPLFSNTRSVQFNNQDYLGANAALLDATLGRTGNGSGSSDAWSIGFYFKAGGSSNQTQTIFYFGSNDVTNGNHIRIYWNGANNSREQLILQYGSTNNRLILKTPVNSLPNNSGWNHWLVTYDGGTTGSGSAQINDYYSRFKIFKNGTQISTINSNNNFGNTTALSGQNLRVGRYNASGYMRSNCVVDELAIWDSDQSANVSSIYNSGTPFDLSTLTAQPRHWWRMGDGDTFPNLQDSGTAANCVFVMNNMTASDIINDVP
jgi:hypothetical protein